MNEQEMSEWECVEWKRRGANQLEDDLSIRLMRSPFYEGDKFSVRRRGLCLTTAGAWEWEPMPSSRYDEDRMPMQGLRPVTQGPSRSREALGRGS